MVVGSIELHAVPDAVGVLADYPDAFPEVSAEEWQPYRVLYPELFAGEGWRLPCKCYLVRAGGVTVLVDTGVGPPGLWGWTAEQEGELPEALDRLGVSPSAVDIVFLTHLHIDHVGWNTDLEGSAFFPRARYLAHRDAVAFATSQAERPHVRRCIAPLADRFEHVDGEIEIAPGITTLPAPGHYPGHLALRIVSEEQEAVLLGDVALHPALWAEPDWVYVSDTNPSECAKTRRALLPQFVDRDVLVACGHYPGSGIGHLVTRDGRIVWEEAR